MTSGGGAMQTGSPAAGTGVPGAAEMRSTRPVGRPRRGRVSGSMRPGAGPDAGASPDAGRAEGTVSAGAAGAGTVPTPPPFAVLRRARLLRAGECVAAFDATVPSGGGVAPHLHEFYEVALIVAGRGQHLNGSRLEPLRPGDVLLLHPATPHGFLVPEPEPLVVRNILFTEAAVGGWLPGAGPAPLLGPFFRAGGGAPLLRWDGGPWPEGEDPGGLGARMVAEYRDRRPGYQSMLQGYLRVLLTAVWRAWSARNPEGPGDDPAWWRLVPVLQRMVQDAGTGGRGPRLPELAALAGWSGPHLSRVFRRVFGRSVRRYLRELRVQRAATLLLTSGEPLDAVAAAAGYSDARALRRAFAASYHRTPQEYRDGRWGREPDGTGPAGPGSGREDGADRGVAPGRPDGAEGPGTATERGEPHRAARAEPVGAPEPADRSGRPEGPGRVG